MALTRAIPPRPIGRRSFDSLDLDPVDGDCVAGRWGHRKQQSEGEPDSLIEPLHVAHGTELGRHTANQE